MQHTLTTERQPKVATSTFLRRLRDRLFSPAHVPLSATDDMSSAPRAEPYMTSLDDDSFDTVWFADASDPHIADHTVARPAAAARSGERTLQAA
ncbi:MAG: hypothetical protein AB7P21_07590 [Lautropia sp.]